MLTHAKPVGDENEADESEKHEVELLEAREDAAVALESAEQSLDLIAALVHGAVIVPRLKAIGLWWDDGNEAQVQSELAGFVAFVGPVHQQMQGAIGRPQAVEQSTAFNCVVRLAGRQRERYGCSSIRGNHMNLGFPSASGLANGLGTVFLSAPVPSGCTLMLVESIDTASILMRTT